jgi:hypothetical protein
MKLPKLHLRDLFWLVLVCALGCGWWLERSKRVAEQVERDRGEQIAWSMLWRFSPKTPPFPGR